MSLQIQTNKIWLKIKNSVFQYNTFNVYTIAGQKNHPKQHMYMSSDKAEVYSRWSITVFSAFCGLNIV